MCSDRFLITWHISSKIGEKIPMGTLQLIPPIMYIPNWLSVLEADNYFGILLHTIHWQTEEIELFGKKIVVPRLVAWYGDANAEYSYSKVSHTPLPWLDNLTVLKNKLEETVNFNSNSVLCNCSSLHL